MQKYTLFIFTLFAFAVQASQQDTQNNCGENFKPSYTPNARYGKSFKTPPRDLLAERLLGQQNSQAPKKGQRPNATSETVG